MCTEVGGGIRACTTRFFQMPGVLETSLEYICGAGDGSWSPIACSLNEDREGKMRTGRPVMDG